MEVCMELNEGKKGKTWKEGKKRGIRGTVAAALKDHPETFDEDDPDKLNPYAVFTAMDKKKKGGIESHYKDQPTTSKKTPKKKKGFKEWLAENMLNETNLQCSNCQKTFQVPDWLDTRIKCPTCRSPVTNPNNKKNPEPWDRERLPIAFPD